MTAMKLRLGENEAGTEAMTAAKLRLKCSFWKLCVK